MTKRKSKIFTEDDFLKIIDTLIENNILSLDDVHLGSLKEGSLHFQICKAIQIKCDHFTRKEVQNIIKRSIIFVEKFNESQSNRNRENTSLNKVPDVEMFEVETFQHQPTNLATESVNENKEVM